MNARSKEITQPARFTKIGADGKPLPADAKEWEVVADSKTGKMWTVETKRVSSHGKAGGAAKKMKAGGFDDWRLPDVEDLFLLADRTRHNPAIDTEYFPDTPSDWFWTSTPYAPVAGYSWDVSFSHGYAHGGRHDHDGFVRAVRGGQ